MTPLYVDAVEQVIFVVRTLDGKRTVIIPSDLRSFVVTTSEHGHFEIHAVVDTLVAASGQVVINTDHALELSSDGDTKRYIAWHHPNALQ